MAESSESPLRDADRLIYAGMLYLSATWLHPMIQKPPEDLSLEIGMYAFGLALPLLAAGFVTDYVRKAGRLIPFWHDIACLCGPLSCIVGIGALLFHVNLAVGIVFSVACVVAFLLVRRLA